MLESIRCKHRFQNYQKSITYLADEIQKYGNTDLDVIKKGIIQSFEITHELAWKLMQDILKEEGETEILGSKSATRMAFSRGLITEGETWLEMIKSRNLTVHTYDEAMINEEFQKIVHRYLPLFIAFKQRILSL